MLKLPHITLFLLVLIPALLACAPEDSVQEAASTEPAVSPVEAAPAEPGLVHTEGSCETVFEGQICSWSKSRGDELLSFGVTVPMTTVESAPSVGEMAFPPITLARVAMTDDVKRATGVDHLGVNWEIYGHPPQTFMTPHFDFHFYLMPGEEVAAITCEDVTMPDPAIVPEGYVLPDEHIPEMNITLIGLCVPEMGMHAVNAEEAAAEEFFDGTMIVGYIYGNPHFIEPMIAKHTLMRREDFDFTLPDVGDRGEGLANPSDFIGSYDADTDAYHLTFMMASAD